MKRLGEFIQTADWKQEKHVPVIECPDRIRSGEPFEIKATVGKEIAHPNTTEHHIRWIRLFFQPVGGKTFHIGNFEFCAHGESPEGPNTGPVHSVPQVVTSVALTKPGTIFAISFCNIHGLWESARDITLT